MAPGRRPRTTEAKVDVGTLAAGRVFDVPDKAPWRRRSQDNSTQQQSEILQPSVAPYHAIPVRAATPTEAGLAA